MSKKIDESAAPQFIGSRYPAPYNEPCMNRMRIRLGDASNAGLTQFGVNKIFMQPNSWSSQRHWHTHEDEMVYVLEGEVVLVTDNGEELLKAGESAGFPAGVQNGHQIINRSDKVAILLEIGTRNEEDCCFYSDIDMMLNTKGEFLHKDGSPFTK